MIKHQGRNSAAATPVPASGAAPHGKRRQLVLDLGHEPSLAESDFIVSPSNELAFEHVAAWPNWPAPMTLIAGPAKSGKSHLSRIWAERSGAVAPEYAALETLAGKGGTQPVLLEDVDRLAYPEDALFHLLNQSMRDHRPVLMTARAPVNAWGYKTDDVLSRARLASGFRVETPDDTQLSQMFVKLFHDRQIAIDPKIVAYLVARMERSTEEVVRLVALMDELALTRRGPVTRAVAAEALAIRSEERNAAEGGISNE